MSDVESTAGTGGRLLSEGGLPHRGNVRKDEARAGKSAARSTAEESAAAHLVHSINEAVLALLGLVRLGVRDLDVSGDAAVAACDLGRPREPCRDKEGGGVGRGRRRGRTLAE
ncbi:MAG: hypothetical protein NUW12_04870 [Firmicutes bacterium]|nr:hypothetical protein [Bacillota bacterium]MDH7495281.1 hypothetical protein [Bacillota bacterium]